jgi:hypothetical protein
MINEKEIAKSDKKIDLTGFQIKDTLNPKVWDENKKLRPEVRRRLLKIANDYFESLEMPEVDIIDVTFTGSLANYNWSKYSDVDLHIVIDYNEVPIEDVEMVDSFLRPKSNAWNDDHDVKIYGYEVELYVQDEGEKHFSTGVYSVLNDEWNIEPQKMEVDVDNECVKYKADKLMDRIEDLADELDETKDYQKVIDKSDRIKDKIKKMRQGGLEDEGEFSVENIVFKVLRRNGMMERLNDIKTVAYDKMVSLEND